MRCWAASLATRQSCAPAARCRRRWPAAWQQGWWRQRPKSRSCGRWQVRAACFLAAPLLGYCCCCGCPLLLHVGLHCRGCVLRLPKCGLPLCPPTLPGRRRGASGAVHRCGQCHAGRPGGGSLSSPGALADCRCSGLLPRSAAAGTAPVAAPASSRRGRLPAAAGRLQGEAAAGGHVERTFCGGRQQGGGGGGSRVLHQATPRRTAARAARDHSVAPAPAQRVAHPAGTAHPRL